MFLHSFTPTGFYWLITLSGAHAPASGIAPPMGVILMRLRCCFLTFLGLKYPKFMLFFAQTAQNGKFFTLKLHKMESFYSRPSTISRGKKPLTSKMTWLVARCDGMSISRNSLWATARMAVSYSPTGNSFDTSTPYS